ncbi:Protochlorophyllide-dependent translocon component 52 [Durusdinium trenchii]|uniref:Chloroplastic (ACD1-like protein) (Protein TIC 55-IV) (Translocon at the inner envelope membrane of chloroplasts 55-IV) n=1 Tax=Durusdinium trenchii TaxID=1381693 RepID=A0ABP0JES3_9DINO
MADLWAEDKLTMKELAEARSKKKVSPGIRETFQLLHFVLLGCVIVQGLEKVGFRSQVGGANAARIARCRAEARHLIAAIAVEIREDVVFRKLEIFVAEPDPDLEPPAKGPSPQRSCKLGVIPQERNRWRQPTRPFGRLREFGDIVVAKVALKWMRALYAYSSLAFFALRAKAAQAAEPKTAQVKSEKRHWFPIASTLELDPQRPTPVRLDGVDLVVWQVPGEEDAEDEGWRVMSDACPHRLAPLSEGRIEPTTKCLQCAYHGWEFNSEGHCTKIPQVEALTETEAAAEKMRQNSRSQVRSFPTKIAMKLVWVWLGESEPQGHPKDLVKGSHLESEFEVAGTYTRDLPYGYDSLVENLIDVSHVPFAHHGLQGTRDDAVPVSMTIPEMKSSNEHGEILSFTFWDRTMGMRREAQFSLRSPFFFFYLGEFKGDGDNLEFKKFSERRGSTEPDGKPRFRLNCACVPVAPGWSRLILANASRGGDLDSILPPWAIHLLSNRFLDSDLAFLHYQERKLRAKAAGPDGWSSAYYMPGESDRSIGAWRQWLAKELMAGSGAWGA